MQSQAQVPMIAIERESACPVHFLWDSVGAGRWLVRAGFLGFVVAGLMMTLAVMLHTNALRDISGGVVLGSAATWLAGHALTRARRAWRKRSR